MERDAVPARLMVTFLGELEEHVRTLNREVLDLEREPSEEGRAGRLASLLRTAHSLKGASRVVGVGPVERACHRLEEILVAVRDGARALDTDLCSLILTAADAIGDAGGRLRASRQLDDAPITALLPRLETAAAGGATAAEAPPPAARPAAASRDATPSEGAVRIPAEQLDGLLAHSSELRVAWRRIAARRDEVIALRERVGRWRADWQPAEKALQTVLHKSSGARLPERTAGVVRRASENLRQLERDLEQLERSVGADARLLGQASGPLDDELRRARMLPFVEACEGLERTVRDLARAAGKDVDLVLEGGEVRLDRAILEKLKDPLRHLVRNAVDHGIEPAPDRLRAGKPAQARVTVAAALRGAQVEVGVSDDGRGLDLGAVRERGRAMGLPEPADEHELTRLVFEPGLSTAGIITDVSGRGVGLDVAKSEVESVHGTIDVSSLPGRGTRFTITVPLTLSTLPALLVAAAEHTFALAGTNVAGMLRIGPSDLRPVRGQSMVTVGGALVPVVALVDALGLRARPPEPRGEKTPAVIVAAGEQRVAFLVDALLAEQEVVVKSLGARLGRAAAVSGATFLPSGRIALLLNAAHLVRAGLGKAGVTRIVTGHAGDSAQARKRVLLVDDSITTRSLERSLLEAAGYEVLVAVDGEAAWRLLQQQGADLLVSDVEMPHLDGFGLTEAVRASPRFRELPIVLVTGRESEQERARGLHAGASAYLLKSAFDQKTFLETVAQLV